MERTVIGLVAAAALLAGASLAAAHAQQATDFDMSRLAKRCEGQREEAVASIYGGAAKPEAGATLDANLLDNWQERSNTAQLKTQLIGPINRDGQSKAQVAGELYQNCLYLERLRELDAKAAGEVELASVGGSAPTPEADIFASMPRRNASDGARMLTSSTNDAERTERMAMNAQADRQLAAKNQAASNAFWSGVISGAAGMAGTYARAESNGLDGEMAVLNSMQSQLQATRDNQDQMLAGMVKSQVGSTQGGAALTQIYDAANAVTNGASPYPGANAGGNSGGGYVGGNISGGTTIGGGGAVNFPAQPPMPTGNCNGMSRDQAMSAFNADFKSLTDAKPQKPSYGARDTMQYTAFLGAEGLKRLDKYGACMGPDYQANYMQLRAMIDSGLKGCEQLSSSPGTCSTTYPN